MSDDIWEGWYTCPLEDCEERIYLLRQEPGPEDWYARVVHDHEENPEGVWVVAVYRHKKGQRYSTEVKNLQQAVIDQKRVVRELKRQLKASRRGFSSHESWCRTEGTSTLPADGSPSSAPSTTTNTPVPASTISSDSSTATPAESTETSSTSSRDKRDSAFLKRLHSSKRSSDE